MVSNFSVIPIRWVLTVDSEIDLLMRLILKKNFAIRAILVFRVKFTMEFKG